MKQTAIHDKAQEQMRPGVITMDGLLGSDARNLIEILEADDAAVKRLGLSHASIAARMRELRAAGAAGLGTTVTVPPCFEVSVDGVRGKLPCPYEDSIVDKVNTIVRNTRLGRELCYTDLNIHMISSHGFYQGKGSTFRLEPADLAEILVIVPTDAPADEGETRT